MDRTVAKLGFTEEGSIFIESLMALTILLVAVTALVPLFILGTKTVSSNQTRTVAYSTAVGELERIKSLPYDDVGLKNGNPAGTLDADTEKTVQNTTFKIKTRVRWIDDPDDGLVPTDVDGRDYKRVTLTLSWQGTFSAQSLTLNTSISRQSEDKAALGGNIDVIAKTSSGELLSDVNINITAGPSAPLNDFTDENGEVLFLTLQESQVDNDYSITASKPGYVVRPDLATQQTTVRNGQVQSLVFIMDPPGALLVRLIDPAGNLIEKNSKLELKNSVSGTLTYQNNQNGYFDITGLFPGIWEITPQAASFESPSQPVIVEVKQSQTTSVDITLQPRQQCPVHLEVYDKNTSSPLADAQVTLTSLDTSQTTTGQTNTQGILEVQIDAGQYTLDVAKDSYIPFSKLLTVSPPGNTTETAYLEPGYGSISVRTQKPGGQARKNIQIRVTGNNHTYQQATDNNGETLFSNLEPGLYTTERWNGWTWTDPRPANVTVNQQTRIIYSY